MLKAIIDQLRCWRLSWISWDVEGCVGSARLWSDVLHPLGCWRLSWNIWDVEGCSGSVEMLKAYRVSWDVERCPGSAEVEACSGSGKMFKALLDQLDCWRLSEISWDIAECFEFIQILKDFLDQLRWLFCISWDAWDWLIYWNLFWISWYDIVLDQPWCWRSFWIGWDDEGCSRFAQETEYYSRSAILRAT